MSPYRQSGLVEPGDFEKSKYPRVVLVAGEWRMVQTGEDGFTVEQSSTHKDALGVETVSWRPYVHVERERPDYSGSISSKLALMRPQKSVEYRALLWLAKAFTARVLP